MKWVLKQAKSGDMVRVKLGLIYHYGVFVSEDEVIQFGLAPSLRKDVKDADIEVCTSDVDTFVAGGFLEVAEFDRIERLKNRKPSDAVAIARSRIGEKGYSILYNNCEHFAQECVTGTRYCSQTEDVRSFFKSLPLLNLYVAKMPNGITVESVEPQEKNEELLKIENETERREQYFAWKLLEHALGHSFCYKIKNLKLEDGEWHTEKCKFDIAMNGDVAAVAISRKEVSIKICAPCENVTEDSDISRIETVSVDGEEYRILIKNETTNSLKVFSDIKI